MKCRCPFEMGVIKACRKRDIDPARPGHKICLYARKSKKLLGRHRSRPSALRQERAIQINKRKRGG